ncbi:hypothetical protein [Nocardia sp. NPDC049149]|uniref:hypothetical protein n=1 Tax=Nocardia sp. NPDC049149 TaxID=3364315 RepID=UPI0037163D7C
MSDTARIRVTTADPDEVIDDPSETALHDLLADMNFSCPFAIVERLDLTPVGQHYIQVHLDEEIRPEDGHGYSIEYREGGPDKHFGATIRDQEPWDMAHSPAFEQMVRILNDWVAERDGWREALPWERVDL